MFFIKIQIVVNYLPDFIKIYVNKYSIFREENTFDLSLCLFCFIILKRNLTDALTSMGLPFNCHYNSNDIISYGKSN